MCEIPGIGPGTARSIIGETGLDVTGVSDTARQLCSWAKLTTAHLPVRRHQTLREDRQRQTGLGQAATGAAKTGTFLGERYRRLVKRMPKAKDKTAIARTILVIIFELLADPAKRHKDLGPDHHAKRTDTGRRTAKLTGEMRALGWPVTLVTHWRHDTPATPAPAANPRLAITGPGPLPHSGWADFPVSP